MKNYELTGNYIKSVEQIKLYIKTKNNILTTSILFFYLKNYGIQRNLRIIYAKPISFR